MLRVTTGCVTCRIRRVKCDEEKPHCRRCKTTGRRCEGYINAPLSRKGLGPTINARLKDHGTHGPGAMLLSLSDLSFLDQQEAQCFDFFRSCSVPNTNLFVTDNFWSRVILQAIPAEPSIKHGILALGALHRNFESGEATDREYAVRHYAKAVRHMGNALAGRGDTASTDYNILLMSIIIFHCFENHTDSYTASKLHLQAGMRLLEEAKRPAKRKSRPALGSSVIDEITRTLHRLDVHSLTFSEQTAPYDWPETLDLTDQVAMPTQLDSIDQARDLLMALFKRAAHVTSTDLYQSMGRDGGVDESELARRRFEVSADLAKWKRLMFEQLSKPENPTCYPSPYSFLLFESYHSIAVMNLSVSASGLETTWDVYTPQCLYLVKNLAKLFGTRCPDSQLGTERQVSYDLGIIAPLFWVAIKCREPILRREAIAVLASTHRREGKWTSMGAASVAQVVIDLEEDVSGPVLKAKDIPEAKRVHLVQPQVDAPNKTINALFWRRAGPGAEWTSESRTLYF